MRRAFALPFALSLLLGLAAACGKSSAAWCSPGGPVAPGCNIPHDINLQVTPSSAAIAVGDTLRITATIANNPSNAAYAVSWSSSDTTKAVVNTNGLVFAKAASPGVSICASASAAGNATVVSCATVIVQAVPVRSSMAASGLAPSRPPGGLR